MSWQRGKIPPAGIAVRMLYSQMAGILGARPMAGQLTLDQSIEVRILCPQPKSSSTEDLSREGLFVFRGSNPYGDNVLCPQPRSCSTEDLSREGLFVFRSSDPLL